jgi:alginate O-acetyltransferase complex protein AlgI
VITSAVFWILLPIAAAIYWRLPKWREWYLFAISAGFLLTLDWKAIASLLVIASLCYLGANRLKGTIRWFNYGLILLLLGFLAYYKYLPPLLAVIRGAEKPTVERLMVPLGISFFTFKLIHYVVDASRKTLPKHGLAEYYAWVFFLPMFAAGPIERFESFQANRSASFSREQLLAAITRISFGLIKKFVVVDLLLERSARHSPDNLWNAIPFYAPAYSPRFIVDDLPTMHPLFAWQFVINHFTAGYIDFSAYNDIAIGTGLLFGVKLTENFDWPILATNPAEYWRRWHITLSNWCQRYIYLPTLAITRQPYVAIYATMITMSLWHEGNLRYLFRGIFWGTLIVIYVTWTRIKRWKGWTLSHQGWTWGARTLMFLLASAGHSFTATRGAPLGGLQLFLTLFGFNPSRGG